MSYFLSLSLTLAPLSHPRPKIPNSASHTDDRSPVHYIHRLMGWDAGRFDAFFSDFPSPLLPFYHIFVPQETDVCVSSFCRVVPHQECCLLARRPSLICCQTRDTSISILTAQYVPIISHAHLTWSSCRVSFCLLNAPHPSYAFSREYFVKRTGISVRRHRFVS